MTPPRRTTAATAAVVVLATAGALLAATATPASAAVTCASPVFKRQFFANTSFSGTPKKTDCDSAVDENWKTGAPASGLPKDNFGVRWSVTRDFGSGGPFALSVSGLDGIRVYVDGVRKVDLWKNGTTTVSKTVNLTIPKGKHTLRVDHVHWTGSAKVKFTYAPRTSATVDKTKPLAPTGLAATYSAATQQTKLTWSKNKEMDLAGYHVYRRVAVTGAWRGLPPGTAGATATSYTDTPPATGEQYEYAVRAYDKAGAGNVSAESALVTVTSFAVTAPNGFTVTGTNTGLDLSWDAVPGAVGYRVIRDTTGQNTVTWKLTGTSLTDNSAAHKVDYRYRVAAVDASGRTAYTPATVARRPVSAPVNLRAFPQSSAVTLTWQMDEDSDTGGDYTGFKIYRYSTPSIGWVELSRCTRYTRILADGTIRYQCTDNAPDPGTTHRYVVTAYDKTGQESVRPAEVVATTATDGQGPTAPAATTATAEEWGTVLTWEAVTDGDLDEYSIRRGTTVVDGDSVSCADPVHIGYAYVNDTSYQDVNLADGEKLCYVVRPIDFAGNIGAGTTVHTTEPDLRPTVETPAGATHVAYAYVRPFGDNVEITWGSPAGTEDYYGARVSRWNPQTGTFNPLPESSPYYDENVPTGTTLWYQVVCKRADGSLSLPALTGVAVPPVS
ncbi:PA14 domain-containing protein [Streptomyces sp. NPDC057474]|uniref:PA14 domain-containing protein n=1 Tax=Streptomyces sp. NPDC057474 TaxID=3346144 RepID=UPI0036A22657